MKNFCIGNINPNKSYKKKRFGFAVNNNKLFKIIALNTLMMLVNASAYAEGFIVDNKGCRVWSDDENNSSISATWDGPCEAGTANGLGTLRLFNGIVPHVVYTGSLVDGKYSGEAELIFVSNGIKYKGSFVDGAFEGKGVFIISGKIVFEGSFVRNHKQGWGSNIFPTGEHYQGEYFESKFHGYGTYTMTNGEKYIGNWATGKRHGNGLQIFANGDRYEGEYVDDLFSGFGIFINPNGEKYTGNWLEGKRNGKGSQLYIGGDSYDGDYVNDEFSGSGVFVNSYGKYVGEFLAGKFNGKGKYEARNGEIREGYFENDKYVGRLNWPTVIDRAKSGDISAQMDLCIGYNVGYEMSGLKKDNFESLSWCLEAAKKGNSHGQYMTGLQLTRGYGHEWFNSPRARHTAAIAWMREAEKNGSKAAGKEADEHEAWFNKEYNSDSDWFGKIIVGAAVTGLVASSDLSAAGKMQLINAAMTDISTNGESKALENLFTQDMANSEPVRHNTNLPLANLSAGHTSPGTSSVSSNKTNTQEKQMTAAREQVAHDNARIEKQTAGDYDGLTDKCSSEVKRYEEIQRFPGAAMNEANISRLKCAVLNSRGVPKATYKSYLDGAQALIRKYSINECDPAIGCIGTLNLGNN